MSRLGRLLAVMLLSSSALFVTATHGLADHCPPIDNPDPIPGQNTTYCHTPKPTTTPEPTETPDATAQPTAAATRRPVAPTQGPVVRTNPTTPEPTPFDLEVPKEDPLATPQIVVDGPLDDPTNFEVAEPTGGMSNWIFGFIFGFLVGGFVGRASWGLRKRRRQQIFG